MRQLAICLFTLLIGLPAVVFGVVFAEADSATNQAKATACQTNAAACQAGAAAALAETPACRIAATACQPEANACTCKPECQCNRSQVADANPTGTRLAHLYKAARHLQAAGLKTEAEHVMAEVHALCEELLVAKVAELVQVEVERVQEAASQHEKILIRVSSVPADACAQIDLHLPNEATRKLYVCDPSQATVYSVQAANGEHRSRVSVTKIMAGPDDAPEEEAEEAADALLAPPAPTAQVPAATKKK